MRRRNALGWGVVAVALGAGCGGCFSLSDCIGSSCHAPAQPTLAAVATAPDRAQLWWTYDPHSARSSELQRSTTGPDTGFETVPPPEPFAPAYATDAGLTPGSHVWYRVRVENDHGPSPWSESVAVELPPAGTVFLSPSLEGSLGQSLPDPTLDAAPLATGRLDLGCLRQAAGATTAAQLTCHDVYLRFDLSTLAGLTPVRARLLVMPWPHMTLTDAYEVAPLSGPWDETTTALTAPPPLEAPRASTSAPGQLIDLDVTALVTAWLDGGIEEHGLVLRDPLPRVLPTESSGRWVELCPRDDGPWVGPHLVVEPAAPGAPAAAP